MKKRVVYFKAKMSNVEEKGGTAVISGYGSTSDIDRGGDRVLPTAFTDTLASSQHNSGVAMLLQHDTNKVIGSWDKLSVDGKGLFVEGTVKYDIDDCLAKIKAGDLRGMSIGYIVERYQIEDSEGHIMYCSDTGMEAGYDYDDLYDDDGGCVRVITKLELVEISVVSTPMNAYSFISSVKNFFADEVKAFKALAGKKDVDGEEVVEPTPAPVEKVEEPVKEDEPEPVKEIEEPTPEIVAEDPGPLVEPEVVPAPTPAPAEGEQIDTNGSGGEEAGGNPAPVIPEAPAPVESVPVEAGEQVQEDAKAALLEEVKPLIASMVEDAVKEATVTLTAQNTELHTTLAGMKAQLELAITALKGIELKPGHTAVPNFAGMSVKTLITDEMVLRNLGTRW